MTRALLGIGGAIVVALFLAALVESVPPPRLHVAVIAEPHAEPRTSPWVVRVSAVDVDKQVPVAIEGTARALGADAAASNEAAPSETPLQETPFDETVARVPVTAAVAELRVNARGPGGVRVALRCPLPDAPSAAPALLEPVQRAAPRVLGARARTVTLALERDVPAATVLATVTVPHRERLAVELLVDGVLRDARVQELDGTVTLRFTLPTGIAADALVVVHVAEPWPASRGAFAALRADGTAVLEGLRPTRLRPDPLSCAPVASTSHAWRTAYEAAAGLFVLALVVGLLVRARADRRRAVLLAFSTGLVLLLCFGGLDLMLRLGAMGRP